MHEHKDNMSTGELFKQYLEAEIAKNEEALSKSKPPETQENTTEVPIQPIEELMKHGIFDAQAFSSPVLSPDKQDQTKAFCLELGQILHNLMDKYNMVTFEKLTISAERDHDNKSKFHLGIEIYGE